MAHDPVVAETTRMRDGLEPRFVLAEQEQRADAALARFRGSTGRRPNILMILFDDVGWGDFGCYGGGVAVGAPTPNIDRLARRGTLLTSCYSEPSCTPSRASIMTGRLPMRHGLLRPPMYGQPGGLDGEVTVAQLLSAAGYVTQAVGKWHMGENVESQPQHVGFDDFFGFLSVSDMYTEWRDPNFNPEIALSPTRTAFLEEVPFNKDDVHAVKGGKVEKVGTITVDYIRDLDQRWADYAVDFLKKQNGASKPFFLYYGTRGCHFDNYPNAFYAGRSPARNDYTDCIVEMNDIFARLVRTLDETGELENTIIVFTSDNGPEQEIEPHGRTPFRGGKGSTWEGGVRVPTFIYWKGVIEPRKTDGLFDFADILPTSLSLAGKSGAALSKFVAKDHYIDGIDQTSFLLATNGESNRRSILYFWNDQLSGVRMDEFKFLILAQMPFSLTRNGYHGGFTGTVERTAGVNMFNLYADPQEDNSIGARHIPAAVGLEMEAERYKEVSKKFPPKVQIGFQ